MRSTISGVAAILGVVSLGACVQAPRLDVVKTGVLPPASSSSSFSLEEDADSPARAMLADCLTRHGANRSETPNYLVQVSEAVRPKAVGASERQPDGTKAKPQWLPGAEPDHRWVRSLALSLVLASTGREVYRITVSERYSPGSKGTKLTDLAKAACDSLATPS
jgi:hypothetical protein